MEPDKVFEKIDLGECFDFKARIDKDTENSHEIVGHKKHNTGWSFHIKNRLDSPVIVEALPVEFNKKKYEKTFEDILFVDNHLEHYAKKKCKIEEFNSKVNSRKYFIIDKDQEKTISIIFPKGLLPKYWSPSKEFSKPYSILRIKFKLHTENKVFEIWSKQIPILG